MESILNIKKVSLIKGVQFLTELILLLFTMKWFFLIYSTYFYIAGWGDCVTPYDLNIYGSVHAFCSFYMWAGIVVCWQLIFAQRLRIVQYFAFWSNFSPFITVCFLSPLIYACDSWIMAIQSNYGSKASLCHILTRLIGRDILVIWTSTLTRSKITAILVWEHESNYVQLTCGQCVK